MKDVNYPLRKAYMLALANMVVDSVTVEVFYPAAPEEYTGKAYILLSQPSNVDNGTKNSSDTDTSMQLKIITWNEGSNAGKLADLIANEVFARIYPIPQSTLDLSADNINMVSTELTGDQTQDYGTVDNRFFIDRYITFKHFISH